MEGWPACVYENESRQKKDGVFRSKSGQLGEHMKTGRTWKKKAEKTARVKGTVPV